MRTFEHCLLKLTEGDCMCMCMYVYVCVHVYVYVQGCSQVLNPLNMFTFSFITQQRKMILRRFLLHLLANRVYSKRDPCACIHCLSLLIVARQARATASCGRFSHACDNLVFNSSMEWRGPVVNDGLECAPQEKVAWVEVGAIGGPFIGFNEVG